MCVKVSPNGTQVLFFMACNALVLVRNDEVQDTLWRIAIWFWWPGIFHQIWQLGARMCTLNYFWIVLTYHLTQMLVDTSNSLS